MNENSYMIMYDGSVDEGFEIDEVKVNLASLFKKDTIEITRFFSGKPVVIKKNIGQATAEKYKNAFLKAGAICKIVSESKKMKVLYPREIISSAQYLPLKCPFLSSTSQGLNFNRMDMDSVPFSSLMLLSVFSKSSAVATETLLLLFVKDFPRPFQTDVEKIQFKEFPGIISGTVLETLKNFIRFLYEQNNHLAIDYYTHSFFTDQQQIMRVHNVDQYINFMGRTLEEDK